MPLDPKTRRIVEKTPPFSGREGKLLKEGIGPKNSPPGDLGFSHYFNGLGKRLEIPYIFLPPLCPGFGHQSTGRASGNNFR